MSITASNTEAPVWEARARTADELGEPAPFFSVILPAYNRLEMLLEALRSVRGQRFRGFEVIVADDGSTDGTVEHLLEKEKDVKVVRLPHGGPGAARNAGIAIARGTYIAFLDSDDAWFPWTLQVYDEVIRRHERPAFLTGTALSWSKASSDEEGGAVTTVSFPSLLDACQGEMPPVGGTPSICLRADVVRRAGGFAARDMNAEDVDLWFRLGTAAGFVQIVSPPVFRQRKHAGNVSLALQPALIGARHLIQTEKAGGYPGARRFQRRRRRVIAANTRSVIFDALRHGLFRPACGLLWSTLRWQLESGHFCFVAAFPFLVLRAAWAVRPV